MAPTALQATVTASLSSSLSKALTVETPTANLNVSQTESFAFGTGANQANNHYSYKATILAGGHLYVDLAAVLEDPFGDVFTATAFKALVVRNLETVTGRDLTVFGNAGAKGVTSPVVAVASGVIVRAKGMLLMCAPVDGYAVTSGATDQIELLVPGANPIDVEISVLLVA